MKKTLVMIIVLGLTAISVSRAQGGHVSFQYAISFGTGDLGDYVSKTSFRGAVFEYQRNIGENISAGVEFGWNVFFENKDYDTYTYGSESLSGKQFRYSNNLPMLLTASYILSPDKSLQPYVNLGIGTMYTLRNTDMGVWTWEQTAWHFALKPEIGVLYELSYSVALQATGKYYMGFASGDLETQSYLTLSAGIAFLF